MNKQVTTTKSPTSTFKRENDGTLVLTVTIPQTDIKKVWEEEINHAVSKAMIPGFREGKAPRDLVVAKLDQEKIKEDVLKKMLPNAYVQAVEAHNIKPIINPKIHVEKLDLDADWVFTATTCEIPEIKLNAYKEEIKKITVKSKIIIPGKETKAPIFDEIAKVLLDTIDITIPTILIEGEIDRQLGQLLGEIKKLGLTLDQYLSSTNKTVQQIRDEYKKKAENDIKLEFALQKIADEEKITVEQKELDEALEKAKDPKEHKQLEENLYVLANILRQQKTLDFIKSL